MALTGSTVSPGIDILIELKGRDAVLQRLGAALGWLDRLTDTERHCVSVFA